MFFWHAFNILVAAFFQGDFPISEEVPVKKMINLLLKKVNFPIKYLQIANGSIDSNHPHAYLTGFGPFKRLYLFDTLLNMLPDSTICAIVAHELCHWNHGHLIQIFLCHWMYSVFWLVGLIAFVRTSASNVLEALGLKKNDNINFRCLFSNI